MMLRVKITCSVVLILAIIGLSHCESDKTLTASRPVLSVDPHFTPFRNTIFTNLFYNTASQIKQFSVEDKKSNEVCAFLTSLRYIWADEILIGYDAIVAFIRNDSLPQIMEEDRSILENAFDFIKENLVSIVREIDTLESWYDTDEAATGALMRMTNSVYSYLYSIIEEIADINALFHLIPEGAITIKILLSPISAALIRVIDHLALPDTKEKSCRLDLNVQNDFYAFLLYRFKFIDVAEKADRYKHENKYLHEDVILDILSDEDPRNLTKNHLRCSINGSSVQEYTQLKSEIEQTNNVLIRDSFASTDQFYGDQSMNCVSDYLWLIRYHSKIIFSEVDQLMEYRTTLNCCKRPKPTGN